MLDPKYTQQLINAELAPFGLSVVWDGNEPEQGEAARFYVCTEDDDTDFVLWDHYDSTDIMARDGRDCWHCHGYATSYTALAPLLAEIVSDTHVAI